ncbi:MAG: M67 family metallopeptidase [Candidatus Thorarchaeota archaeon]|nr:M67 family metallopeptidase [Candidatus Thorarchaeota archaeon]
MAHYLHITKMAMLDLEKHAAASFPLEAAALLFGTISDNSIFVNRIEPMQNESENKQTSFTINPEDQYRLLIKAEELGESLVGIFHSHPAPAYPSKRDQRNMRLNPVVWLVSSKTTGTWVTKAYILENDDVVSITIHVSE